MFPSWIQLAIVALLVILLFGRGKISSLMGDVAKGITSFKKGLRDDGDDDTSANQDGTGTPRAIDSHGTIEGEAVKAPKKDPEKASEKTGANGDGKS
ncbi:twin-arginine translocase TatA/TatE family subunit [Yunchengibacter salinarum]|uniref:twin-arginine translocase TatA/TatE family subunit n=1 Tax=Yunchengibacter salinarum TaxID=3133399 RepID=UPI0035B57AA3